MGCAWAVHSGQERAFDRPGKRNHADPGVLQVRELGHEVVSAGGGTGVRRQLSTSENGRLSMWA